MAKKFAAAINCMDGRVQLPVIQYLKENYKIDYVDMITEPGPIKILSELTNTELLESIIKRLNISINKHKSNLIAVTGHHDCAGNPVCQEKQINQIKTAIEYIKSLFKEKNLKIIGLWIDENLKVKELLYK